VAGFTAAMRRLLTDEPRRAELQARGRERVQRFTLEAMGEAMWHVCRQIGHPR
jgi:hypothetical protein